MRASIILDQNIEGQYSESSLPWSGGRVKGEG